MTTRFVFLCPHNAAKSIYAAATMERLTAEFGIDVSISTGGTDPDAEVLPLVRERLEAAGHVVGEVPKLITAEPLDTADHIINIGCPHDLLPTTNEITDWDIPNFSDDPAVAFAALDQHVAELAHSLTN